MTEQNMAAVDIGSGWDSLWQTISNAVGMDLGQTLAIIAAAIFAFAVGKFFIDKARGRGGDNKKLMWMLAVAAVCAGPEIIIPAALSGGSWLVTTIVDLWNTIFT